MTAMTAGVMRRKRSQFPVVFLFIVILMAVGAVGMHAIAQHGAKAEAVYRCINSNGPSQTWQRSNGYKADVCQVEPGKFGVRIYNETPNGTVEEITAFIKDKMKSLEQIERYLVNSGYTRLP